MKNLRQIEMEKLGKLRQALVSEQFKMRNEGRETTTIFKSIGEWIEQIDRVVDALKRIDDNALR